MDRTMFCEEMYSSCGGVVVRRHKFPVVASIMAIVGIGLLVTNVTISGGETANLKAALVLFGVALTGIGLGIIIARMFGSGTKPYLKTRHCFLECEELYFEKMLAGRVRAMVEAGDIDGILRLNQISVPSVAVLMYHTADHTFVAMQPFEYVDLEYRPLAPLKVVNNV